MGDMEAREAERQAGISLERLYEVLKVKRDKVSGKKLLTCSYLHHRDNYEGTQVEKRITYDNSVRIYFDLFLEGIIGYVMPSSGSWMRLLPKGRIGGRDYSDFSATGDIWKAYGKMQARAFQVLGASNFYEKINPVLRDYYATGTCYMSLYKDEDGEMYFQEYDPQDVVIAEDHKGKVDVFIRKVRMEAIDFLREFPSAVLKRTRETLKRSKEAGEVVQVEFLEAILPRDYLWMENSTSKILLGDANHKFAHVVIVPSEEWELVLNEGCDCLPVEVARFNKDNEKNPYGVGLVERSLDSIVKVDDYAKTIMMVGQRIGNPPLLVSQTLKGKFSTNPGKINYTTSESDGASTIELTSPNFPVFVDLYNKEKQELMSFLKADLFQSVVNSTDSRRTAYEVSERKNEALVLLQLSLNTLNKELLSPLFLHLLELLSEEENWRVVVDNKEYKVDREFLNKHVEFALDSVFIRRLESYLATQGTLQSIVNVQPILQLFPETSYNFKPNNLFRRTFLGSGGEADDLENENVVLANQKKYRDALASKANAEQNSIDARANRDNAQASSYMEEQTGGGR